MALAAGAWGLAYGNWPCPVRRVLGLSCPGCGMTRGLTACLHGDWSAAWQLHPLAPLLLLLASALALCAIVDLVRDDDRLAGRLATPRATLVLLLALLTVHAVRPTPP